MSNFVMLLYASFIVLIIILMFDFFRQSSKISKKPKERSTMNHNKVIEKYMSNTNNALLLQTKTQHEEENNKMQDLKKHIQDGDITKFILNIKEILSNVIDGFKNKDIDKLKKHLSERLLNKFTQRIEKLAQYNLVQSIDVDYQLICIKDIASNNNDIKVSVDIIANQISSVKDDKDVSYDNPNNIYQAILYKIDLTKETHKKQWFISKLEYEEMDT